MINSMTSSGIFYDSYGKGIGSSRLRILINFKKDISTTENNRGFINVDKGFIDSRINDHIRDFTHRSIFLAAGQKYDQ